jgi:hypothetical protein
MPASDAPERTYGNYRRPRAAGIKYLGALPSALLLVCVIINLVIFGVAGPVDGFITLAVIGVIFGVLLRPDHLGLTPVQKALPRAGWVWVRATGQNQYRSGPHSHLPSGTFQLPGLLSPTVLSEHEDAYGQPFALLWHRKVGQVTVVIESEPPGTVLTDQPVVDQQVANYGGWLTMLSEQPGLIAAQVCIETSPDPGVRLRQELDVRSDANAPTFALQTLNTIAETYPAGSAELTAYTALTYSLRRPGSRLSVDEAAEEIALALPDVISGLQLGGGGYTRPLDGEGLCDVVHRAYNPREANALAVARSSGEPVGLSWADCGPVRAEAHATDYWHDGAYSSTYAMSAAPRGEIRERALQRLLRPHEKIPRKRVTMLYRIVTAREAARIVDQDVNAAQSRHSNVGANARSARELQATRANARDEARGASLVSFGMLATITAMDADGLKAARSALTNAATKVDLRPVWGSQDSAFAAALPCGLFLPTHLRIPDSLRNFS